MIKYHCVQAILCCFGDGKNTFGVCSAGFIIRHVLSTTVQSWSHCRAQISLPGLSWYNYATVPTTIKNSCRKLKINSCQNTNKQLSN